MISLANDRIALSLDQDFGGRVTSLTDLVSGRQWLVPGACVAGGTYLGDQARGWDECFPTVGSCDHPAWGGPLRDHGELWGRSWGVTHTADACTATYDDPRFAFTRSLHLNDVGVIATYQVINRSPAVLPYLWSQHALLATTTADRIVLDGVAGLRANGQPVNWPDHLMRDLSTVGAEDEGFALKLYGDTPGATIAAVIGKDGGIHFGWSGTDIGAIGLWLDYGGWPPGAPVHQVALESTTAPVDDLAQAEAAGCVRHLAPGQTHSWSVRVSLTRPVSAAFARTS